MSNFKSGDKLRCIEGDECSGLQEDSIYTCIGLNAAGLVRIKELNQQHAWYETRFEPLYKASAPVTFKVVK